jgi:hypothetical protein
MTTNPIIIKDVPGPIKNTRQVHIDEKSHLIKQQFSFKRFRTEKERISELMKEKANNDFYSNRNLDRSGSHNKSILQPTMRFKPRTDLERVYQAANEYSYGRISKEVIEQHLKALELNSVRRSSSTDNFLKLLEKRPQSSGSKNHSNISLPFIDPLGDQDTTENKDTKKLYEDPKKIRQQLKQANLDARRMMGDFHVKTHFKAAETITFNLDKVMNKPVKDLLKANDIGYLKRQLKLSSHNQRTQTTESDEEDNHKMMIDKLNKIPYKINKPEPPANKEDMQFLKQLYMSDHLQDAMELKRKKINFYSIFKKQNRSSLIRNDPLLFFESYSNNSLLDVPAQQKSKFI